MARRDAFSTPAIQFDRRRFLATTAITAACWPFAQMRILEAADRTVKMSDYPFQLGIASGDPAPDGVVLWTRLVPEPLTPNGGMPPEDVLVEWQVSTDEGMTRIVRKGTVTAPAEWAHSVHVEVDGLEPDRVYWYQFKHGAHTSPVGRTRTAPRADALVSDFRFAFASCQHYETGYYNAYDHMSQDDLKLVVHLGDYIYEGAGRPATKDRPREHAGPKLDQLEDYRIRYSQYKMDPHLQAVHAAFPWLVTWDDHEVENNYADLIPEATNTNPAGFPQKRANAYKAYYEHMPLRRSSLPKGPDMRIYRTVSFGKLVQFCVLDTRQHRSDQPCGDGRKAPCPEVFDPQKSILGNDQERWLQQELVNSSSQWNVLAQQVPIARIDASYTGKGDELSVSMDKWTGYEHSRQKLINFLADRKISNPIILTGDVHANWVNNVQRNADEEKSPNVATEFVGTSISSGGDGTRRPKYIDELYSRNPFVKYFSAERGYVRCEVTPKKWKSDYRAIEIVSKPNQPCFDRASFIVENNRPGAVPV